MTKHQAYYLKRQESLRSEAVEFRSWLLNDGEETVHDGISRGRRYFRKYGKRFGLIGEFRKINVI